jgi:hypothetical protein
MKRKTQFFVNLIILLLILWIPLKGITAVSAQTAQPPPQKVIATGQYTYSDCPDSPLAIRLEVWNIGSAGGSQYSTATMTITGYSCVNGKTSGGLATDNYEGTFSGGPDGDGKLTSATSLQLSFHFVGGKSVEFQTFTLKVENPEAFIGGASQAQEASPTPASEPTEAVTSTPELIPTEAVGIIPPQVPANDCLKDPLNAAGCMSSPIIRQGAAAVVSVAATLAAILVIALGSPAAAAGEVEGIVAGGAVGATAAGANTGAKISEATTEAIATVAAGAATAADGTPSAPTTDAAPSPEPSQQDGSPTSGTMKQSEYRQLKSHLEDLKILAHNLEREELEWRTQWRWLYDLHEKGITDYQSNASKAIIRNTKDTIDWTPVSPVGPEKVVSTAVEKFVDAVTDHFTTPPPNQATDAQILAHMRERNKFLREKMEEAKKRTYEIYDELTAVREEINAVNQRIQDNPILLP